MKNSHKYLTTQSCTFHENVRSVCSERLHAKFSIFYQQETTSKGNDDQMLLSCEFIPLFFSVFLIRFPEIPSDKIHACHLSLVVSALELQLYKARQYRMRCLKYCPWLQRGLVLCR